MEYKTQLDTTVTAVETVELHDTNITVIAILSKTGQNSPVINDNITVTMEVRLPVDKQQHIQPDICFSQRCVFFGKYLSPEWGQLSVCGNYRTIVQTTTSSSWKEAEKYSIEYLYAETEKLQKLIIARVDALIAANNVDSVDNENKSELFFQSLLNKE